MINLTGLALIFASDDGEDDSKKPVSDIGQFDAGTIYASDDLEAIAPELDSSFVDASQVGGEGIPYRDSVCSLEGLHIPNSVNIRNNITEAERHRLKGPSVSGALIPLKGAYDAATDYSNAKWFENQVRSAFGRIDDVKNGKSWDYKQLDPILYENFGNWNYGLTGAAMGFSERLLLRMAGKANLEDMPPDERASAIERWGTPGNVLTDPKGGTKTFGDDPKDQHWIRRGYAYYKANCGGRNL